MTQSSLRTARSGATLRLVPQNRDAPFLPIEPPPAPRHAPSVYLASLSVGSRRAQRTALGTIAHLLSDGACDFWTMPWEQIRFEHTAALRAHLADNMAPATANRYLAALRKTLKAAWRLEQIDSETLARAVDVEPVRGERLLSGRMVTSREKRELFEVCEETENLTSVRDAAILAIAFGAGLRRGEIARLEMKDYDSQDLSIRVRRGKGNKDRLVFLNEDSRDAVDFWLEFRGKRPGPLLHPLSRGGRILRRQMSDETISTTLKRLQRQAAIRPFSPHDCRRTWISELLDDADISTVQKQAGHQDPKTTARYDRRGEAVQRKAAEGANVPFKRPKWAR